MSHTAKYVEALKKENATGVAIEHAYRPALKNYLEALLTGIIAINDPKAMSCGRPDYTIRKGEINIGYIEAKDINVGLDKVEKSDQMKRYLESLGENFILTDYLEFRFYRDGKKVDTVRIAELGVWFQMDKATIKPLPDAFEKLETLLSDFVGFQGQTIKSPKQLAEIMARKAKLMRQVFADALEQDSEDNTLREQWNAFQEILIHDMDEAQFADVYAQTITYGLFTARLHDQTLQDFSREEARGLIPRSNPFVRQLFDYVCGASLDHRVVWIVDALCEVYRAADVHAILTNFGRATGRNDPIVHFYEDFLGEYDKKLKKARGVWYTPEPVVNFIVRAVDEVLKTHFHLPDGLADTSKVTIEVDGQGKKAKQKLDVHRVQLLDVAAGTGTFTAEAIKQIYSRFLGQEGMWSAYVEEHLLPRLHGFEILMASYAMCHLKIDMLLQETGYKPKNPNNPPRLGVYLTNALEEHHPDVGTLFASWLAREANEASRIKKDIPIMVAYGNPPYSGVSSNNGEWITEKIEDYKYVDGVHFGERKHWLQDDYVKFIRLAEHYVEKNGHGVLAYITNHGYLDNPTFRGMRWHLLNTFDDIYVLDLHGSSMKSEAVPDGLSDKNVFDIKPGVAIIIAVKHGKRKERLASVHFSEVWGDRPSKYSYLWERSLPEVDFVPVEYNAPNFFFCPKNETGREQYEKGFSLNRLMPLNVTGIVTARDALVIAHTEPEIISRIEHFSNLSLDDNTIGEHYFGSKKSAKYQAGDSRGWKLPLARRAIANNAHKNFVQPIAYRPFDIRKIYYTPDMVDWGREKFMSHLLNKENLGLLVPKAFRDSSFAHCFVTNTISEAIFLSGTTGSNAMNFPLYLYHDTSDAQADLVTATSVKRKPNLDDKIVATIAKKLKLPFVPDHDPDVIASHLAKQSSTGSPRGKAPRDDEYSYFTPLDLLDYIYAVLHSPSYRSTYKEFLKIDFPRIPYPVDASTFWQLVALGGELRALHLLEHPALAKPITTYPVGGDNVVEKPTFTVIASEAKQSSERLDRHVADAPRDDGAVVGRVYINAEQYFGNVPEVAWNFYIGGYQPAQKWLKDRKGRTLSLDDLRHYAKIILALTETDRLMKAIDGVWKV